MGFVARPLFFEDVELHLKVGVGGALKNLQRVENLEPDELIAKTVALFEQRRRDDEAIDEGEKDGAVVVGFGLAQFVDDKLESITLRLERLVVLEGLERAIVALGAVHAEGR